MACTDAVSDVNNALHKADDEEAPVITLEYGPYRTEAGGITTLRVFSR